MIAAARECASTARWCGIVHSAEERSHACRHRVGSFAALQTKPHCAQVFLRPGARAKVAAAQPSNGGSGGGAEKEDEEEMDADDGNALLQLMGFAPGPAPGLRLTLDIALYLLDPRSFLSAVKWQQKQGLLPQCGPAPGTCLPGAAR